MRCEIPSAGMQSLKELVDVLLLQWVLDHQPLLVEILGQRWLLLGKAAEFEIPLHTNN